MEKGRPRLQTWKGHRSRVELYRNDNRASPESAPSRALSIFLHLYEDAVTFCNFNKYMTGYADTDLFGPSNELTRAEFVTVLHRIVDPEAAGVDFTTVKNETGFADVEYGN